MEMFPGASGIAQFEISEQRDFKSSRMTGWLKAQADTDYIVKTRVTNLKPGTRYFYRVSFGPNETALQVGDVCSFRTLQTKDGTKDVSFVVVTGMNYMSFHYGKPKKGKRTGIGGYEGDDKELGFPALATMLKMQPDFFVGYLATMSITTATTTREATDITGIAAKMARAACAAAILGAVSHCLDLLGKGRPRPSLQRL